MNITPLASNRSTSADTTPQATVPAAPSPKFRDEAPPPIVSQQLDLKLGITVLELQFAPTNTTVSYPSQKQLDAYTPQTSRSPNQTSKTV